MVGWARKKMSRIINIPGNHKKIAGGFALGWIIGFTPFVGLQVFISMAAAMLLRLNKPAAVLAVFNTNVFSGLFIYVINYRIGTAILGMEHTFSFPDQLDLNFLKQILSSSSEVLLCMTLGGMITGIPTSIMVYYLILYLFKKSQYKNEKIKQ